MIAAATLQAVATRILFLYRIVRTRHAEIAAALRSRQPAEA